MVGEISPARSIHASEVTSLDAASFKTCEVAGDEAPLKQTGGVRQFVRECLPDTQHYRPDIDGLRAIAVLIVILDHAKVPGFSGGFIGVDIFFVVSGYLITQILMRQRSGIGAALLEFYERRVRRIAPALIPVLLAASLCALILFSPYMLKQYGSQLLRSTLFIANYYFANMGDYFVTRSELPLQHLWSLGVEEQFYIAFPLAVLVLRRSRFLIPLIATVLCVSLLYSEWMVHHQPIRGYYITPTRIWELMAGCLAALLPARRIAGALACEALSLCAAAAMLLPLVSPGEGWAGLRALPTCGGTALLLWLHQAQPTKLRAVLGATPLVAVGLISYSLYLWHWPIFEFYRTWVLRPPSLAEFAVLIGLTFAISALSWRYIERPFRQRKRISRPVVAAAIVASGAVLLGLAFVIRWQAGLPSRFTPQAQRLYAYEGLSNAPAYKATTEDGTCSVRHGVYDLRCLAPRNERPYVLLFGDSIARSYFPGLRQQAGSAGIDLRQASHSGCSFYWPQTPACSIFTKTVLSHLDNTATLILAAHLYAEGKTEPDRNVARFAAFVDKLQRRKIPIIVLGIVPNYPEPLPSYLVRLPSSINRRALLDASQSQMADVRAIDAHLAAALRGRPGVTYVSLLQTACNRSPCPMTAQGAPAAYDQHHFTIEGSQLYARLMWPQIRRQLPASLLP